MGIFSNPDQEGLFVQAPKLAKCCAKRSATFLFGRSIDRIRSIGFDEAEVVSFDVFDTLVLRRCVKPADVFELVEQRAKQEYPDCNVAGFAKARSMAESVAREVYGIWDVTLDEVYSVLPYNSRSIAFLKATEIAVERDICYPNPEMFPLFRKLIESGKRICITSDMYLPGSVIEGILQTCGYDGYESLFVSCEYRKSKRKGGLFLIVASASQVPLGSIVHIGDNLIADFVIPSSMGIRSYLYRKSRRSTGLFDSRFTPEVGRLDARERAEAGVIESLIQNNAPSRSDDSSWMGYSVLGPLLYGYSSWLHDLWEREGRPPVWFLAREGRILKAAYESLYGSDNPNCRYINVSRVALCRALAYESQNEEDFADIFSCLMRRVRNVDDYLNIIGVQVEDAVLEAIGISRADNIGTEETRKAAYGLAWEYGRDFFKEQHDAFLRYMSENGQAKGKIIVCDLGWSGTIQSLLRRLLPETHLIGAYLAVSDNYDREPGTVLDRGSLDRKGYWCDSQEWSKLGRPIRYSLFAIESLFMTGEGTTTGYRELDGHIEPIKKKEAFSDQVEQATKDLDAAALTFINDCDDAGFVKILGRVDSSIALLPYLNEVVRPKDTAIRFFKRFSYVDGVKDIPLLPNHAIIWYLAHPRTAMKEFELNSAKILWLKALMKLPIPYYEVLCFMTERMGLVTQNGKRIKEQAVNRQPNCNPVNENAVCKPLNVVYVADIPQTGGASACLYDLVLLMTERYGVECTVLFPSEGPLKKSLDEVGIRTAVTGHRGFLVSRPQSEWKIAPKYCVEFVRYLLNKELAVRKAERAIDFSEVDVVHSNLPRNDLGIMLAKRHNIVHVCHLRELSFGYFRCWSYRSNPVDFLSNNSDALIAVSQSCADAWINKGADSNKLEVIHDGIDYEKYAHVEGSERRDGDSNRIKLLFLGGCSESKGVMDAIGAIKLLPDEIKEMVLLDIYGTRTRVSERIVRRRVTQLGLDDYININGYACDIPSIMSTHDVGLVCSSGEAFGRVVIEFQAGGLAVIGPDCGSIPELLDNGKRGVLYEKSGGAAALAKAINALVSDKQLLQEMKAKGPLYAVSYKKEHSAEMVYELYECLLGIEN